MSSSENGPLSVVLVNQVVGPLFRDLAEDLTAIGRVAIVTGWTSERVEHERIVTMYGPAYQRSSSITRVWSWFTFMCFAAWRLLTIKGRPVLLLSSNPPMLQLLGYWLSVVRRQPYVVLVYDLYPDVLERAGVLSSRSWVVRLWRQLNRLAWNRASAVITIGWHMRQNMIDAGAREVYVIRTWADTDRFRPMDKSSNWFAEREGQTGKLTFQYSGNMGATHELDGLFAALPEFSGDSAVRFLFAGAGPGAAKLAETIRATASPTVKILDWQKEEDLPFSLATADVAVVCLSPKAEGCSLPSKAAFALASGSALLVLGPAESELARMAVDDQCGISAAADDVPAIVAAIRRFRDDPKFLASCRTNARLLAIREFSRANTQEFVRVVSQQGENVR